MKMCKKGIAWILALMLVLSMAPSVFAAEGDESGEPATEAFDISKSKEATQLKKTGDNSSLQLRYHYQVQKSSW